MWAELVHPDLEPGAALERLWERRRCTSAGSTRPTPPPRGRRARTSSVGSAERLTERGFDALHYEGPGTDLTIGLLPGHQLDLPGGMETVDGLFHMANLPTEEIFTSPDPARADGVVTSTKPLVLRDGTVVRDLVVRFEGGRVVELTASTAQETLRTIVATRRGRRPPRRVRAGRRLRAASARSTPSSTTRSSTRTPPRTSPSASGSRRRCRRT